MDEKTKKDLIVILEDLLDRKFEEKFILLFNQGFEEVVMPRLEDLENEQKKGFKQLSANFDNINRRSDNHSLKLSNHETRLNKLENPTPTP